MTDSTLLIVVVADSNGTIEPGGNIQIGLGGSQSFIITPKPGYRIDTIIVDSAIYDPFSAHMIGEKKEALPPSRRKPLNYNFENVRANHLLRVTFVPDQETYTITIMSEKGGIIRGVNSERPNIIIDQPDPSECQNPSTDRIPAAFHESRYFAVIPAQGYDVDSIIADGVKFDRRWNGLGVNQYAWPIYTFDKIESDHLLRATFTKESH